MSASNRYLVIKPLPEEEFDINSFFNKIIFVGQIVTIKDEILKTPDIEKINEMEMTRNEMVNCFKEIP